MTHTSLPDERRKLVLLDVVGLTPELITESTPHLLRLSQGGVQRPLECPFPALTLSSQASILTGKQPSQHGIVGNGWYFKDLAEPYLWRQPHALLQSEDLPTELRRTHPEFTVAKLFWWFNMYAPVDWAVTPRPMYPADGRKVPDIHTSPSDLRDQLQSEHGQFPLFRFWGPAADMTCSRWITDASKSLIADHTPHLSMVYIPHLDYDFQRFGPHHPTSLQALKDVDALVGEFMTLTTQLDMDLAIVSEYGIEPVDQVLHPNRHLRDLGWLSIRMEEGKERLDCGASRGFALSDHQISHLYVRDPADIPALVKAFTPWLRQGVEQILHGESRKAAGMDHPRAGDVILVADPGAWFSYYFWHDESKAPDYAHTVDIHRKPGYDPAELFLDPNLRSPKLRLARRLLGKKLGMRNLMDVVGTDPSLVKGSHGRKTTDPQKGPIFICSRPLDLPKGTLSLADLQPVLKSLLGLATPPAV